MTSLVFALGADDHLGRDLVKLHGRADKSAPAQIGTSGNLEVFTPPAVRYGRADAARRTAARSKQQ